MSARRNQKATMSGNYTIDLFQYRFFYLATLDSSRTQAIVAKAQYREKNACTYDGKCMEW